ncbi:MAG: hypothetical protein ACRD0L_16915 [Acidimicrobiales bacterium]
MGVAAVVIAVVALAAVAALAVVMAGLPPVVVVSNSPAEAHAGPWDVPEGAGSLDVVLDDHHRIARRFETFATPHLFVVGPDGRVGAQGVVNRIEDVRRLLGPADHADRGALLGST